MGYSFVIVGVGVVCRWIATFVSGCQKTYNNKERAFMGFAWIPKATVQAALGSVKNKKIMGFRRYWTK